LTESLEHPDYTDWTWEQHLAKATSLAAKADQFGDGTILSEAARRQHDVQQCTARGLLHAKLAELKKDGIEVTEIADAPPDALAAPETAVPEQPAETAPPRRQAKTAGRRT